jgi:hypothetical protein
MQTPSAALDGGGRRSVGLAAAAATGGGSCPVQSSKFEKLRELWVSTLNFEL